MSEEKSGFILNEEVLITDLDYMGLLSHYGWVMVFERARFKMLAKIGWPLSKAWEEGVGAVIKNIQVDYSRPARYGDLFTLEIKVHSMSESSCKMEFIGKKDSVLLVSCIQTAIFIDIGSKKPTKIPATLKAALEDAKILF